MTVLFILPVFTPNSMFKTLKEKMLSAITAHPKLAMFGIGLTITFVIGTVVGMVETQQANAFLIICGNGSVRAGCR